MRWYTASFVMSTRHTEHQHKRKEARDSLTIGIKHIKFQSQMETYTQNKKLSRVRRFNVWNIWVELSGVDGTWMKAAAQKSHKKR